MKTLTYSVPDELAGAVDEIEDLDKRITWFVKEQAALEKWRKESQSSKARELAANAIEKGAGIRGGEDSDTIRERLRNRWKRISEAIQS